MQRVYSKGRPANPFSLFYMAPTNLRRKPPSTKKLSAASIVGAPAQHNQPSRKGKKAWRKNVDIEDLERKLEGLREEERAFGCEFLATLVPKLE